MLVRYEAPETEQNMKRAINIKCMAHGSKSIKCHKKKH
jgi:hypothetical protein